MGSFARWVVSEGRGDLVFTVVTFALVVAGVAILASWSWAVVGGTAVAALINVVISYVWWRRDRRATSGTG
ncbi:hypothetical protein GCM10010492_62130 [Saccharothrix mutabilis subsp. mutabilis]|uniref:Uncharacterized protein n=1 Tax=Saccharothrix mutabilis subsp. mutabilis TaxID=66855 RepID=A0ABN0UJZ6_9PSEU